MRFLNPVAIIDEKANNCIRNDTNRIIILEYGNKRQQQMDNVVV
jgi:hypothetical protein